MRRRLASVYGIEEADILLDRLYRMVGRYGVGAQIMNSLILHSESLGMSKTFLHSQLAVQSFYEYLGYKSEGPIFDEAGIPHVYMARRTNNA